MESEAFETSKNVIMEDQSQCHSHRRESPMKNTAYSPTCNLCNAEVESSIHLFLKCHFAKALWTITSWGIRIDTAPLTSGEDIIKLIINPPNAPILSNEQWTVTLDMALIIDEIWNSRNLKLFQQEQANLLNAKHHVQARFQEISKVFAPTIHPTPRSCSTS